VMINNARISDLIRESRPEEITDAIADGEYFDMQTFEQALIALVLGGSIDDEAAANASSNRHDFLVALERAKKRLAVVDVQPSEPAIEHEAQAPQEEPTGLRVA